jgi:aldehyde:ferredoxin oxidoreductase
MGGNKQSFAYAGKILRINLSNGKVSIEPTLKYAKEWLGASGIAIKMLYDELRSWVTPFEPANKLIFGVGALVGTTAFGANKMNVNTLSPMTGGWGSSHSDSYLGGQIKYSGYDVIVIEGKAHRPVYLWINDDVVEIRDASHLWGQTTWDTLDLIREELNDDSLHIASIGPAGENLVRGACIIQDKGRAFGRCGIGAVMGAKNLKALVAKGSGGLEVFDRKRFMEAGAKCRSMFKNVKTRESFHKYGLLSILERKQEVCGINYKNFQECCIPEEMVNIVNPKKTIDKYEVAHQSYPGCGFGGCSRIMNVTEGPYAGLITEINQWETFSTLQTRLAINEPTFMLKVQAVCNQMGLDVDAAGGSIGWAMECFQRGIIDSNDTDGLVLNWGDSGIALELIRKMCYREGFGDILAEGSARAADIIKKNSEYYAMHIKNQDLYEPCRGCLGWCLGTTTSTRGGGHTTGAPVFETVPGLDVEKTREVYGIKNPDKPQDYEEKPALVYFGEILQRINNCFGICHYNTAYYDSNLPSLPELAELYSAATGFETTVEELKYMAMRQLNLEKAFNLRFTSFERKDDLPTSRDLNEAIPSGALKGWKMDLKKYNEMLDEYYDLHGWDKATSFPTRGKLTELNLNQVADDLEKIDKLGRDD